MKIGMICPYSLSMPGGVQGQVLGLARALRVRSHMVRVLAPCDGPPPEAGITALGPSIQNSSNGSMAPIAPDPGAQLRTMGILWDEDFDVIHIHEPLVPGPSATALILKPGPLVGTFHAAGDMAEYRRYASVARRVTRRLDAKVAVSEEAKALASTSVPGPWTVLYNGVELAPFRDAEPWSDDADDGRPTILFLGRHEERKGLEVLLAALEEIPNDVRVLVAGEGPETGRLRSRYTDRRIEWLGRVSDQERNGRMAAASVFCAPSIGGESFGVILLEAMAAGAPVVGSSIAGYTAVGGMLDGNPAAALLPEAGNPSALAADIVKLLDDASLARELIDRGSRRAERFSMAGLAEAYEKIYEAIR